jgi:putative membrane protein
MHQPTDDDEDPTRNELAEGRTILASERTFGSWMRTSLGCVAICVAFQGLFSAMQPPWVPRLIATGFLGLAVLVIVLAERRSAAVLQRLSAHAVITAKVIYLRLFAVLISVGAIALAVAIWTVEIHPSPHRVKTAEPPSPILRN